MFRFVYTIAVMLFAGNVYSQIETVFTGTSTSYTTSASIPSSGGSYNWEVVNGTILTSFSAPDAWGHVNASVTVLWTNLGTGSVKLYLFGPMPGHSGQTIKMYVYEKNITILAAPPTPNASLNTNYACGSTIISISNSPTNQFYEWWWQSSPTGQSTTLGKDLTITRTTGGNLYLRSRLKVSPFTWSPNSQLVGNIVVYNTAPSTPLTVTGAQVFAGQPATLSVGAVNEATSYKWYNADGSIISGVTSNSYTVPILTSTTSFFVSAVAGGCESTGRIEVIGVTTIPKIQVEGGEGAWISRGESITLTTSEIYTTYSWYRDGSPLNVTTPSCSIANPGNYTVQVTKTGMSGTGTSQPFPVKNSLEEQHINYIVSNTVLKDEVTSSDDVNLLPVDLNSQVIQYFDDLGRPVQVLSSQASPINRNDIVETIVYDGVGREKFKYLPYTAFDNTGRYKPNTVGQTTSYLSSSQYAFFNNGTSDKVADDQRPFSETVFEPSPLNRPRKNYGPGEAWSETKNNRPVEYKYLLNVYTSEDSDPLNHENIIAWGLDHSGLPVRRPVAAGVVEIGGVYASSQLAVMVTIDEMGNEVRKYHDKEGRLILKRVQAPDNEWADTYYIYDDFGNLVVVLPPEAVKALTSN